jgi:hypothetical protein
MDDIMRETKVTTVKFDEVESPWAGRWCVSPMAAVWSFFVCPFGRKYRNLRLYDGGLACPGCLKARGLRFRVELFYHASKRAALTAPKRIERLNSETPARLHPRPGRMLDKRANLELRLKRSLIVERRAGIAQFEKDLRKP